MRYRLLCLLLACTAAGVARAQAPAAGAPASVSRAHSVAPPAWRELNAEQREALAPLAADWDKFDPDRKKKWLEIAAKYPNMSTEGKQRFLERMPQLAKLTPEQRETARENFRRAYSLPPDQRQALTQKYQELPEDRKRALAAQAKAKKPAAPPRRPATPVKEASSSAPAGH
jgi:hypothetical protein